MTTCAEKLRYFEKGYLDTIAISIYIISLSESSYATVKREIMAKDKDLGKLTLHPRYIRYLGTCFNPSKLEAYVITDFVAGCTIQVRQQNWLTLRLMCQGLYFGNS